MSYRSKVELMKAREIIAGFLLWHEPAYKPGPSESLEKMIAEADAFLWGPEARAKWWLNEHPKLEQEREEDGAINAKAIAK